MTDSPTHTHRVPASRRNTLIVGAIGAAVVLALALLYLLGEPRHDPIRYRDGELALTLVRVIEGPGTGPLPTFSDPLGVAFSDDGKVFVSDTGNNRICVFDENGKFVRSWGVFGIAKPLPGYPKTWVPGRLNYPTGVDVGDDGSVYVADFRNDQICVFTQSGRFVRSFPDPDEVVGRGASGQDGRGIAVTDVVADAGKVFATDAYQVVVFDRAGRVLQQFGKPGQGRSDLDHPNGLALGDDGLLYVADSNRTRLTAFTPSGTSVWSTLSWKDSEHPADGEQAFGLPRGIAVTHDKLIIVSDAVRHELVISNRSGDVLATLGRRGLGDGEFNFPADVATHGSLVAVADKKNDRVQIFKLERQAPDDKSDASRMASAQVKGGR